MQYKLRISETIREHGLTNVEVARRLGVNKSNMTHYCNASNVTLDKLARFADAIGCNMKDLFVEENEQVCDARTIDNPFLWDSDRERQMRLLVRTFDSVASDICALRDQAKDLLRDSDISLNDSKM